MGITTAKVMVDPQMLEASVRDCLNETARRAMAVLDPLKITILNCPPGRRMIQVPNFPAQLERGSHEVPFLETVFIDRSDFKEVSDCFFFTHTPIFGPEEGDREGTIILPLILTCPSHLSPPLSFPALFPLFLLTTKLNASFHCILQCCVFI